MMDVLLAEVIIPLANIQRLIYFANMVAREIRK